MTIMDLLDTAVKIGLGALISGVTMYWITTSKNRHEINYDLIRRRLDFLEQSAEQAECFFHDYTTNGHNGAFSKVWKFNASKEVSAFLWRVRESARQFWIAAVKEPKSR